MSAIETLKNLRADFLNDEDPHEGVLSGKERLAIIEGLPELLAAKDERDALLAKPRKAATPLAEWPVYVKYSYFDPTIPKRVEGSRILLVKAAEHAHALGIAIHTIVSRHSQVQILEFFVEDPVTN